MIGFYYIILKSKNVAAYWTTGRISKSVNPNICSTKALKRLLSSFDSSNKYKELPGNSVVICLTL
jgi:hypothetical protein